MSIQAIHDQITREFIAGDPVLLDIYRPAEPVSDGAGGKIAGEPTKVASDTFRLVPQQDAQPASQGFNGRTRAPRYIIVATHGFSFERGDWFDWRGYRWEIVFPHDHPAYETKADVERKGAV